MASDPDVAAKLKKLAKNKKYDELEEAVLEALLEETVDRDTLLTVLIMTARRADAETAESIAWLVITSFAEAHGDEEGLILASGVAEGLPKSPMIREELAGLYLRVKQGYPGVETVVQRIVAESELPLPEAVERADQALELPPGTYVVKRGRKDPGRVIGVAEGGGEIEVEFAAGPQAFAFRDLSMVEVLDPTHFRALAVFEPEMLTERAAADPSGLVEDLLRVTGGALNYRELRTHLVDVVPGDWSSWWSGARAIVQRSPWVEMSVGRQPTLTLRRKPLEHDERVQQDFEAAETVDDQLGIVIEYLEQAGEHAEKEEPLVAFLAEELRGIAEEEEAPLALGAIALLGRLQSVAPDAVGEELPEAPIDELNPADLLFALEEPRLKRFALEHVKAFDPDGWPDFLAAAMPACSAEVCDWAARELTDAGRGKEIPRIAASILEYPNEFAEAMIWVYKSVSSYGILESDDGPDPETLLIHFIGLADRAAREERTADANRLRGALATKNYAPARTLLETMNDRSARRVNDALGRFPGLTDHARVHITDLIAETHPGIYAKDLPLWDQDDIILTTQEGLDRKQVEYAGFVHKKLPAVAEAIGRAAAHGDLSENAEYTAALEERERLTERANSLKAELDLAVVIAIEAADGDTVTVGSRIEVREVDSGEGRHLTFLGPWDVDVANGVYSYRAPLSLGFMGRGVGDKVDVELDGTLHRYEILTVTTALR